MASYSSQRGKNGERRSRGSIGDKAVVAICVVAALVLLVYLGAITPETFTAVFQLVPTLLK